MTMMDHFQRHTPRAQRGFVIAYVFVTVALLAALAAVLIHSSRTAPTIARLQALESALRAQAGVQRERIGRCVLEYPSGNNGTGFHPAYPGGSAVAADSLICPGAPAGNQSLWAGQGGDFMPQAPSGFVWTYTNDASGVSLHLTGDAQVLARLLSYYATNEAQLSGATLTLWISK